MGKRGGNANKKAASKKADDDFDALLDQLQTKTKEAGLAKDKAQAKKGNSLAQQEARKQKHEELVSQTKEGGEKKDYAKDFANTMQAKNQSNQSAQNQKIQELIAQMQAMQGMGGMGGFGSPFMSEPKTDITTEVKSNKLFDVATVEMQGWRKEMEDAHFNDLEFSAAEKCGLFGVFDGHSGKRTALEAKVDMNALAKKHYDANQLDSANFFFQVFSELDQGLKNKAEGSGATAVVAMISEKYITCASVGDSRAVLCRDGKAVDLSYDHKPENEEERARIEAAGGHCANNRVNGELAMSRAIGDFRYKEVAGKSAAEQLVIAVPEIHTVERDPKDQFVVVACDGIFDVLSNEEVVAFVVENRPTCKDLKELGSRLLERCLAPETEPGSGRPSRGDGTDNMTCTIIDLL